MRTLKQSLGLGAIITLICAVPVFGQDRQVPPGTNPAERVVYPAGGQDTQKQMSDQLECYYWSSDQTAGWDPYQAHDVLVQKGYVAADQAAAAQGGAIRGGAGGSLAGLAIGAIAGDAGKGAAIGAVAGGLIGGTRSRRGRASAESQMDAALEEFSNDFQRWDRAWVGCMQSRDYTIT